MSGRSTPDLASIAVLLAAEDVGARVYRAGDLLDEQPIRAVKKRPPATGSAQLNRHTGQPHQHSREIARRLRQQGEK